MIIPISRENRLCHYCSHNAVKNEAHFILESPLYDPIRDKFLSLFENVVLDNLKSFFQLDDQVDISLYLMKATTSPPLLGITWFETILVGFPTLKSISMHCTIDQPYTCCEQVIIGFDLE